MVPEDDVLIHLGDVIFSKASSLSQILEQVKCRKVLVKGNHDLNKSKWYMDKGFDFVSTLFAKGDIVFSHIPIEINGYFPQKLGWKYNVHGHFHNTDHRAFEPEITKYYDPSRHVLYAPELRDYKPVKLVNLIKEHENNTQSGSRQQATQIE